MARMRDLLEANEKLGSANQVERLGILEEETRLQAAAIEEQIAHHEGTLSTTGTPPSAPWSSGPLLFTPPPPAVQHMQCPLPRSSRT